jgi:hypothetical protein
MALQALMVEAATAGERYPAVFEGVPVDADDDAGSVTIN